MRKRNIDQILSQHREAIGAPARRLERHKIPSWRGPLLAAPVVAAVSFGAVFLLWPKDADAKRLQELKVAIQNARSMEIRISMRRNGQKDWREYSRQLYLDGMWRYVTLEKSPMECTYVLRNSKVLTDIASCDHVTVQPLADIGANQFGSLYPNGLEFATELSDLGVIGPARKLTIKPHEPVNGRPTYLVTMAKPPDEASGLTYRGQILVDKQTNLPIETIVHTGSVLSTDTEDTRWAFQFNIPLAQKLFELKSAKPIIDLEVAERQLTSQWTASLFEHEGLTVRDICATTDGTIWIASSRKTTSRTFADSIVSPDGQTYLRAVDMEPSNVFLKEQRFKLNGDPVRVVGFIPLRPGGQPPKAVDVAFATSRDGFYAGASNTFVGSAPTMNVRQEPRPTPSYFVALDLDHFSPQIPKQIWIARAEAEEKTGDPARAAWDYEQLAEAYRHFIPRLAVPELKSAVRLYEAAGRTADAARVQKELND